MERWRVAARGPGQLRNDFRSRWPRERLLAGKQFADRKYFGHSALRDGKRIFLWRKKRYELLKLYLEPCHAERHGSKDLSRQGTEEPTCGLFALSRSLPRRA